MVQERQIQPMRAKMRAATAQRTQTAPNQSSSWPLSRTICRQPVQTMSRPKPMLSKGPTLAFLM